MKTGFQLCCLGCNACQVRCSISGGSTCICVEVFRAGFIIILFPGYWFDSEYRGHQKRTPSTGRLNSMDLWTERLNLAWMNAAHANRINNNKRSQKNNDGHSGFQDRRSLETWSKLLLYNNAYTEQRRSSGEYGKNCSKRTQSELSVLWIWSRCGRCNQEVRGTSQILGLQYMIGPSVMENVELWWRRPYLVLCLLEVST